MKILCVHPGANWSTQDVYTGIAGALQKQGHELVEYALDTRIRYSENWLNYLWRRGGKKINRPNAADAVHLAGYGILERALWHNVDWVLIISAMYVAPDWLVLLRRAGVKVGIVFTESPYEDHRQIAVAPWCNIAWTNERTSVATLRTVQPNTFYLPHSYDPGRHHLGAGADMDVPAHDVVFVGTGFPERIELLSEVNWDGIDLGLYGGWDTLGSRNKLRRYLRGDLTDNLKTSALYRKAKIGLNLHRQSINWMRNSPRILTAESLNPRAYELAACGLFHISDYRPEIRDVFRAVVPTFTTPENLEEQIRYYLREESDRNRIAVQLPGSVAGCTFDDRVATMMAQLEMVSTKRALAGVG